MTSFWTTLLDWFLPSIRLTDDINDLEALRISSSIASSHQRRALPPTTSSSDTDGYYDRRKDHDRGTRERHRSESRAANGKLTAEDQRTSTVVEAEVLLENKRLKAQLAQLDKELRSRPPPTNRSRHSSSPSSSTSVTVNRPSFSDDRQLRTAYEALSKEHKATLQRLHEQSEEIKSLHTYLTKIDQTSGADLVDAVTKLNDRIRLFASTLDTTFFNAVAQHRTRTRAPPNHEMYRDIAQVVGSKMVDSLISWTHEHDNCTVRFAIQAWVVGCVAKVFDCFCFGAAEDVDDVLMSLMQKMIRDESNLATVNRWKAMTHGHLTENLSSPSSVPPTPVTPSTPSYTSNSQANLVHRHASDCISGCHTILSLTKYPSSVPSLDRLTYDYRSILEDIYEHAVELAKTVRQGFMSTSYEVVTVDLKAHNAILSESGQRHSTLHVRTSSNTKRQTLYYGPEFDGNIMQHAYELAGAGYHSTTGRVVCTLALGLRATEDIPHSRPDSFRQAGKDSAPSPIGLSRENSSESQDKYSLRMIVRPEVLTESALESLSIGVES